LQKSTPHGLYACGPNAMLEKLEEIGKERGIRTQLSWEAHMRCGIGVCGSCELTHHGKGTGWLVCQDGPVESSK
jgi:dihydroorotate dehydrogenase electron transfer subunit